MHIETYVLSLIVWFLITETSLGMSRFLKLGLAGWFAVLVAVHVFAYTQTRDWRDIVQAGMWLAAALDTYFAKPIDERGFWRDWREEGWPTLDAILIMGLLFGAVDAWGWVNPLQMTQPAMDIMMVAEGAKGEAEVKERIRELCPEGFYVDTLWSGKLYVECPSVHDWGEQTQLNFFVKPDPQSEAVAVAAVGFSNETGKLWFTDRGPWD